MIKDSISSVSIVVKDTIQQDSLQQAFPFDPIEGELVDVARQHMLDTSTSKDESDLLRYQGKPLPFNLEQTDGIFCLLLICVLFFAYIYRGGISFLKENLTFLFSPQKASRTYGLAAVKEMVYSYFLVFQFVVLVSVCVYDVIIEYETPGYSNGRPLTTILSYIVLIALFLGVKDMIYKIIGYIFDFQKTISLWRRTYMVSVEILGILYFIPTLLLIYSSYYHTQILVFMLILFLLVQIILFYQIIVFFINQKFNFLYLIAYLCTFEILPYIFLSTGLIYLYRTDVFNILLWP
ncbi:MAG: DUF4271 domain-containing protein [Dysgonomonas sp.]